MSSIVTAKTFQVNDTLNWSGQTWGVRNEPATNTDIYHIWNWSSSGNNIWIDDENKLHMTIKNDNGAWNQTHIYSKNRFRYGTFSVKCESSVLMLDKNVVCALFTEDNYFEPTYDLYHNEIDIEYTKWGETAHDYKAWYTVQPDYGLGNQFTNFHDSTNTYNGTGMTMSIDWQPTYVRFKSIADNGTVLSNFTCTNVSAIPSNYTNIMFELWLFNNVPPSDGKDIEVVFSSFNYTPLSIAPEDPGCNSTPPVAAFSASPTCAKKPMTMTFTDRSIEAPTSWYWIFGDGTYSTRQNPVHTYSKAGNYTVKLTVKNAAGSNTTTKSMYFGLKTLKSPVAAFSVSPISGSAPLAVRFIDRSTGSPIFWKWNFGDRTVSTAKNPVHKYTIRGKHNVTLTVKNVAGSSAMKKSVYVR